MNAAVAHDALPVAVALAPEERLLVAVPNLETEAPDWQPIVDGSYEARKWANRFSDIRADVVEPAKQIIAEAANDIRIRAIVGIGSAALWVTDFVDGYLAKEKSIRPLRELCERNPEAAKHPTVQLLLSPTVLTDGSRRDELRDKDLDNGMTEALAQRAAKEEDLLALGVLVLTNNFTRWRNPKMNEARLEGIAHGIPVGASTAGRAKTALKSTGETLAAGTTTGSLPNRLGYGMIAGSNVLSGIALVEMRRRVKKGISAQHRARFEDATRRAPSARAARLLALREHGHGPAGSPS